MDAGPIGFFASADENGSLGDQLDEAIRSSLASADPLNGTNLRAFEQAVARISGRRHAIAVGSCTDALFFALAAAGVQAGDEVLVPAFSFIASAAAVVRLGARPVFVDILDAQPAGGGAPFTMDLERAAEAMTGRTRAMLWVGLFGGLADPDPIMRFAERRRLILIEDAAQSFGATFGRHPGGGMGVAGCFSFDRQKVLAAPGTGGAVVTDDDAIAASVRALRWHGSGGGGGTLGYNSQLSNLSAAILNLKLERLPEWLARRRAIADAYDRGLAGLPLTILHWSADVSHARHKYVVLCGPREALQDHLERRGVPTRRHYAKPLPAEPLFAESEVAQRFPVASRVAQSALSLPIHPFLSDGQVEHVVGAVREFFA